MKFSSVTFALCHLLLVLPSTIASPDALAGLIGKDAPRPAAAGKRMGRRAVPPLGASRTPVPAHAPVSAPIAAPVVGQDTEESSLVERTEGSETDETESISTGETLDTRGVTSTNSNPLGSIINNMGGIVSTGGSSYTGSSYTGSGATSTTTTSSVSGVCTDPVYILLCGTFGTNSDCSCNKCPATIQYNCELSPGGSYNTQTCTCTLPSGTSLSNSYSAGSASWWKRDSQQALSQQGAASDQIPQEPKQKQQKVPSNIPGSICPKSKTGCQIPKGQVGNFGGIWYKGNRYECLDISNDVDSCGGCVSEGFGQDCTTIENASDVGCVSSTCVVSACEYGWIPSDDKTSCVLDVTAGKRGSPKTKRMASSVQKAQNYWR